jgi:glutathione S-transferase
MFDAIRAKGREHVRECFKYIEKNLEGKTWVVGDSFTVVDAYLVVFYRWGNMLKMGMRETYPSYTRAVDGVVAQDDVKRTIESEAISVLNE